jgi:hypothetical protein
VERFRDLLITSVCVVTGLVACGGASIVQQGPSDTLRAYAEALEEGRADDAYRLLADDAKRGMSLEAFRRAVRENPADVAEIAHAMARPASDPLVTATVTTPNGDELLLVFEGDRWRIDASAIDLYGQRTPRQAITGFVRAFERHRYDVILRYVPDADREGPPGGSDAVSPPAAASAAPGTLPTKSGSALPLAGRAPGAARAAADDGVLTAEKIKAAWEGPQKAEMNQIVQAIKTALPTAPIEETGDSAAMSYGAGGTVALVREHGLWKIREL